MLDYVYSGELWAKILNDLVLLTTYSFNYYSWIFWTKQKPISKKQKVFLKSFMVKIKIRCWMKIVQKYQRISRRKKKIKLHENPDLCIYPSLTCQMNPINPNWICILELVSTNSNVYPNWLKFFNLTDLIYINLDHEPNLPENWVQIGLIWFF